MYEWFFNNSPTREDGVQGSKLVANMFKRTRPMLESQAYLHLFKKRLMPEIDARYALHMEDPGPDREVPMNAFAFRNAEAAKMYATASDTIKALVEKYRAGTLGLDDDDLDDETEEDMEDLRACLELEEQKRVKARDT